MTDDAELPEQDESPATELESHEYQTLAHGVLSPRHRRLAQLAAQGQSNAKISEELGYSGSRVSILLKNPFISAEVLRLQERIFEESIAQRLKSFSEPALNNIHMILTDRTNRVKISEKMALSQWVVEKLDGKATQKIEAGENLLAALMDRLDAQKAAPRQVVNITNHITAGPPEALDVTPKMLDAPQKVEEDLLEAWVSDFDAASDS